MHHLKGHENIVTLIGAFEDRASVHLVRPTLLQWVDYVREDLQVAGTHMVDEVLRHGQAGGLPQDVCCNAPDLRIGRSVMND